MKQEVKPELKEAIYYEAVEYKKVEICCALCPYCGYEQKLSTYDTPIWPADRPKVYCDGCHEPFLIKDKEGI